MILSPITFPGLGISVDPPRIAFYLGQKPIYWYGIIIAIGFLLAVLYALRRCKAFGLRQDDLLDGVLWVTPFAIVCTRAYYCIFYWDLYRDNPISCLYIWDGGLAIYGGIIGAAIGILVFSRVRKLPVGTILDITSLGFLIGQAVGRWGNFFNREAHGYETDSFLRMGLTDAVGHVAYYHPTFLYESCWNLLGFVLLHFYSKRRKYDGQIATMYLAWYGFGRMFIEGLRTDSLYLPGTSIRVSQLLAAVTFVGATALFIVQTFFRKHDASQLFVNRQKPEAQADQSEA